MFPSNHVPVDKDAIQCAIFCQNLKYIFLLYRTGQNSKHNWLSTQRTDPLNIILESLVLINLIMDQFVISNKIQVHLAKIKNHFTMRWHRINPSLDIFPFLFVTLCQSLQAFSLQFHEKSILSMQEHINKRVSNSKVICLLKLLFKRFRIHIDPWIFVSGWFGVEIKARGLFWFLDHFSHLIKSSL